MTMTDVIPVTSATMTEPNVYDRFAVAALLDVDPMTITRYMNFSKPGGKYEETPFPQPDGRVGDRPYWMPETVSRIRVWSSSRRKWKRRTTVESSGNVNAR